MKKNLIIAMSLCLSISLTSVSLYAETPIRTIINGKEVMFDQPPMIEEGRTLVSARAILEELGLKLEFDEETRIVTAKNDETTILMTLDSNVVTVNGEEIIIDVPAKILGGRTMIPIRFICEIMDLSVDWDESSRLIKLNEKNETITPNIVSIPISNHTKQAENLISNTKADLREDFSEEHYINFPDILNYIKFSNIENKDIIISEDTQSLLRYKIRYSVVDDETTENYIQNLINIGFKSAVEEDYDKLFKVVTLSKDNRIVQIETGVNEPRVTISVYESQKYATADTTLNEKKEKRKKGYYNMTDDDIKSAIIDGENEVREKERALRKYEYYEQGTILKNYKIHTESASLSKKKFDISLRTPYIDIFFEANKRADKMFSKLQEPKNSLEEEVKYIYESKYDFGNNVFIYIFYEGKEPRNFEDKDIVLRQDGKKIEWFKIEQYTDTWFCMTINLNSLDTSKNFEIIVPSINNSELVYLVDLSKYK